MKQEKAAEYKADAAFDEALVGNMALAKQEAQAALALANGRIRRGYLGHCARLAGDSAQAARLAADLGKRFPEDTLVQLRITCP